MSQMSKIFQVPGPSHGCACNVERFRFMFTTHIQEGPPSLLDAVRQAVQHLPPEVLAMQVALRLCWFAVCISVPRSDQR